MRTFGIVALLICALSIPVLAAETPEATTKRVSELEKANLVLQEDLSNTQVDLAQAKIALKKAQADAMASDAALKKQIADEAVQRADLEKKTNDANSALAAQIADLRKALADQAARNAQETAALNQALANERADRLTAEANAAKARDELAKRAKKDRTVTYVLGALLTGLAIAK